MSLKLGIIKASAASLGKEVIKHSPGIMAGLAIGGVVTTAYLAFKAGPKAFEIVDEKKRDLEDAGKDDKELRRQIRLEMVRELAPVMAPMVISGVITMVLIFGSHSINVRRQAVLSAAYNVTKDAYKEYRDKTKELVGPKKATTIHDEIMKDHLEAREASDKNTQVIVTGNGDVLCLDDFSGREFMSSYEKIRTVINDLNFRMTSGMEAYMSVNEFYAELGLDPIRLGSDFGWNANDGLIDISFTTILNKNKQPCLVLDYDASPDYRYIN